MIYAIYEGFYEDVEKKLKRISKKCIKHGNDFIFKVTGKEVREIKNHETNRVEYFNFILVDVEGTAKIDDWECIAVMEVHEVGNIIRRINTEIDIPERFRTTKNFCEHCNSKRQRNNLYIIHNTVTDDWKQVGGNCLMLYTNGLNMEYVTAWMDGITELEEFDGFIGTGYKPIYKVEDVLHYANCIINRIGYFNANSDLPTKRLVRELLFDRLDIAVEEVNKSLANHKFLEVFSQKDFDETDELKDIVTKIIEYYSNLEDNNEFIHNVKVMLNEGYIESKNVGFLAYLPKGYYDHIQKEIEIAKRKELDKNTNYFGEVGKRYKEKKIHSVTHITSYETMFGVTYIYKIMLEDGIVLIWKTSSYLYLEIGEEFDKITFTVKEHKEYNGEKQTEVTRCKVTKKKI